MDSQESSSQNSSEEMENLPPYGNNKKNQPEPNCTDRSQSGWPFDLGQSNQIPVNLGDDSVPQFEIPPNNQIPHEPNKNRPNRRKAPTHQHPMKNFYGTLRHIFLKKFLKHFGNEFMDIPLLEQLNNTYLTKKLLNRMFKSDNLRPIIDEMFETRFFHKALRLSKVKHPRTLAIFFDQIYYLRKRFQQKAIGGEIRQ